MLKLSVCVFLFVFFCLFDCLSAINVPPIAKVIWRRGLQLKISSDRLVKLEIEPVTPGLQGEEFIYYTTAVPLQRLVFMDLRPYYISMTDPWSYFGILLVWVLSTSQLS